MVLDPAVFEAEKLAARDLQNVHFVDLSDHLCREDVCWSVRELGSYTVTTIISRPTSRTT